MGKEGAAEGASPGARVGGAGRLTWPKARPPAGPAGSSDRLAPRPAVRPGRRLQRVRQVFEPALLRAHRGAAQDGPEVAATQGPRTDRPPDSDVRLPSRPSVTRLVSSGTRAGHSVAGEAAAEKDAGR